MGQAVGERGRKGSEQEGKGGGEGRERGRERERNSLSSLWEVQSHDSVMRFEQTSVCSKVSR